jgi:hypothetical protein
MNGASVWEGLREASCCQHLQLTSNPDWRGASPPPQHTVTKLGRCRESGPSSGGGFPFSESRRILDNERRASGQATEFKNMCRKVELDAGRLQGRQASRAGTWRFLRVGVRF